MLKQLAVGLYQANCYIVSSDNAKEGIIIDPGDEAPRIVNEISRSELTIRYILITHGHFDHIAGVKRIVEEWSPAADIALHPDDLDLYRQGGGAALFGLPFESGPQPNLLLNDGQHIQFGEIEIIVYHTPGHTPGHVAYYEPEKKLLFCGDVLLPTIVTNAALHVQHIINPIQQYLHSLKILKKLDVELVLPGHEYIFSGHRQRIDEIVQHIRNKNQEIIRSFTDNVPRTAYAISRLLSWSPNTKVTTWFKLSDWDKRFAVLQTTAHLEELVYAKKLARFSQNDIIYYQKP